MKSVEKAKALRMDFMQGHGKGYGKDALVRQQPWLRRRLTTQELTDLYATNAIVQNIIDIPAEDMTRSGFDLVMEDESLKNNIMSKLRDLKVKYAFKKARSYERLYGDGFISLGVTQSVPFELADPLDPKALKRVDYIHPFSGNKVNEFILNEDMFSPNYGQVEFFQVNRRSRIGQQIAGISQDNVHASRLIHDQTRRLEDEYRGQPLLEPLYDIITVLDTSLWSVGQILYDFAFKVYKSDSIVDMDAQDKYELGMLMDYMFRTEALAVIGKEEELTKETTNTTGISDLLDYVWDYLSGAVRMPKTVIKGQEAGTITGAQYDVMNYYSRIAAMQENEMRPNLERLIRLLLQSEEFGKLDPEKVDWKIKFIPLWQVDAKTDAEIRKLIAETDQIYVTNGILTVDEVRETRFGQFGLTNALKFSGDEADLERMAKEVYGAWKERGKNG